MMRCGACGKFLSVVGGVRCTVCPSLYHKACIGIPEVAQVAPGWICPECKTKTPKSGNNATPVKHASSEYRLDTSVATVVGSSQSTKEDCTIEVCDEGEPALNDAVLNTTQPLNLALELRLFREELGEVRKELKEFRTELFDMRSAISNCNRRIDDLEKNLVAVESRACNIDQIESHQGPKVRVLEETIVQLQQELNERDQELLVTDVEISNLPEVKGENPTHTVTLLAAKLGLNLESKDVIFAERVGRTTENSSQSSGDSRGRRLIVRLARRSQRDELIHSARVRRGATTADMGFEAPARRFYVNERLTKTNRQLFYLARETAKKMQWRYTWTKRGRIYTRKGEGQPVHTIKVEADIARVFGVMHVGGNSDINNC